MSLALATEQLTPNSMVWQQVFFPHPLTPAAATSILRQWSAERHAPQLVLEVRADHRGVEYVVGSQLRHASRVRRTIEQLAPGAVVTGFEPGDRNDVATARRMTLTSHNHPLEPSDQPASSRAILHAMTAVKRGEEVVLQLTLGPRRRPSSPPISTARSGQSYVSQVLNGTQRERPNARQAIIRKLGQHGFAATLRIGARATAPERRKALLLLLASSLSTVESPGVHFRLRRDDPTKLNRPRSTWSLFTRSVDLSVPEVMVLSGWPVSDRDGPFPGQPPRHPKPVRPTDAVRVGERIVATANAPGTGSDTIGYSVTDAMRHSWIIGPSGVGKSTLLLNLVVQDLDAGRPVVVIEPKDLVTDILSRIPKHRQRDVVVLDPLDTAPVGINMLSHAVNGRSDGRSPELVADSVFGTLHALYGDSLGPRSADILRNCLSALARRDDASLVMVPLLLTNPGFRRSVTQHAMRDDPYSAGPFWQWFDSLSPDAAATVVAPLSNKLRPLLTRHMRAVLAQRQPRFTMRQVLREGKVLLVPLQKGVIGPDAAQLLGALVVAELWQAIRERASIPESDRDPVMIYIDEVQDYLKLPTDLGDVLATARSLRAGLHLAHQFEAQLPRPMLDAVRNNARSRIAFQLQASDARDMAAGQSVLASEDFTSLPAHHVYASLIRDNSSQPWASGTTLPPPPKTSDPDEIRALSREQYGQPLDEIEAGFADLLDTNLMEINGQTSAQHGRKVRRS